MMMRRIPTISRATAIGEGGVVEVTSPKLSGGGTPIVGGSSWGIAIRPPQYPQTATPTGLGAPQWGQFANSGGAGDIRVIQMAESGLMVRQKSLLRRKRPNGVPFNSTRELPAAWWFARGAASTWVNRRL